MAWHWRLTAMPIVQDLARVVRVDAFNLERDRAAAIPHTAGSRP
jgi:hypothetical protein